VNLYSAFIVATTLQSAQAWITQFYLQITPRLPFLRVCSPDVITTATAAADIQLQLTTHLSTLKNVQYSNLVKLSLFIYLFESGNMAHKKHEHECQTLLNCSNWYNTVLIIIIIIILHHLYLQANKVIFFRFKHCARALYNLRHIQESQQNTEYFW